MRDRFERAVYSAGALPPLRAWISRLGGAACFAGGAYAGVLAWKAPSPGLVATVCLCVVVGALLLSLPDYFRYVAAVRLSPPMPERVEEAFEKAYQDLAEMREVLVGLSESLPRQEDPSRSGERDADAPWTGEMEEELARLRLDLDAFERKIGSLLPDDDTGGKPLPEGMLAKALSRAGKGSKLPNGETKDS